MNCRRAEILSNDVLEQKKLENWECETDLEVVCSAKPSQKDVMDETVGKMLLGLGGLVELSLFKIGS